MGKLRIYEAICSFFENNSVMSISDFNDICDDDRKEKGNDR